MGLDVRSKVPIYEDARTDIFGVPLQPFSMLEMLDAVDSWIERGARRFICTLDVHALMESQADEEVRRIYSTSVAVADGMPIVWLLRRRGCSRAERICGPDLMPAVFRRSQERGYRHFLYGSSEDTLARLQDRLHRDFCGATIVGTCSPPFRNLSETEDAAVTRMLNEANPDIIWVGLGAPKQDRWMAAHREVLRAPVLIGVGAAFDMMAGAVHRAPRVFQRTGCEWIFRLVQEPRRLGKRYLKSNSRFAVKVVGDLVRTSRLPRPA